MFYRTLKDHRICRTLSVSVNETWTIWLHHSLMLSHFLSTHVGDHIFTFCEAQQSCAHCGTNPKQPDKTAGMKYFSLNHVANVCWFESFLSFGPSVEIHQECEGAVWKESIGGVQGSERALCSNFGLQPCCRDVVVQVHHGGTRLSAHVVTNRTLWNTEL